MSEGGYIHITGVTHIDGDEQVFREADDLYHVGGFYQTLEEFEAALSGGDPTQCNNEETWDERVTHGDETLFDYMYDWFNNQTPSHECVTDDYLIWMMDYNDCHCHEI